MPCGAEQDDGGAVDSVPEVSEYELMRRQNIARNQSSQPYG
jgi:hypothetical protein